jgi:cytochrome c-type biogenesis protein CcmE
MHGTENVNPDAAPVRVLYRNTKPDMFAPGRDVIIDGSFDGEKLVASRLLTQCPSKYEPAEPGKASDAQKAAGY